MILFVFELESPCQGIDRCLPLQNQEHLYSVKPAVLRRLVGVLAGNAFVPTFYREQSRTLNFGAFDGPDFPFPENVTKCRRLEFSQSY